jgi:hypothetical protein
LEKPVECINSEAFCSVGSSTLNAFLKKETLSITEMELFKALLKWADKECERQGLNIEHDKKARRRILGDCVYEIPFLAMSEENFVKYVSPTGILTDTEIVSISQKLHGLDVAGLKWKEHKKRQPCIVSFSRFDPANVSGNRWGHTGGSNALTLVVNKAVLFHGVRLFGSLVWLWKEHKKKQPCIVSFSRFDPANVSENNSKLNIWNYTGGSSDALSLVVNKAVLFHGVRLFGCNGSLYEVKFTIKDKNVT